jgi:hypothetical protein
MTTPALSNKISPFRITSQFPMHVRPFVHQTGTGSLVIMSLPTKKEFLESVATLSYDETQAAAAKFARQHKGSELLSHWISEMRKV